MFRSEHGLRSSAANKVNPPVRPCVHALLHHCRRFCDQASAATRVACSCADTSAMKVMGLKTQGRPPQAAEAATTQGQPPVHGPCTALGPCRSQASRAQPGARSLFPIPYVMCVHAERRTFGAGSATGRGSARAPWTSTLRHVCACTAAHVQGRQRHRARVGARTLDLNPEACVCMHSSARSGPAASPGAGRRAHPGPQP